MYLIDANPTAENIARLIFDYASSQGIPDRRDRALGNAPLLCDLSARANGSQAAARVLLASRPGLQPWLPPIINSPGGPRGTCTGLFSPPWEYDDAALVYRTAMARLKILFWLAAGTVAWAVQA